MSVPAPIIIKEEVLSDSEEIECGICTKVYASEKALTNHVRMEHVEEYLSGDMKWKGISNESPQTPSPTKPPMSPTFKSQTSVTKRTQEILSAMKPTSITSLASKNVSYIIVKADDPLLEPIKKAKKAPPKRPNPPKRPRVTQPITGPFECLEASPLGADGICHQMFFSCCDYSAHARSAHTRRRTHYCQVCEKPLPTRNHDTMPFGCDTCGDGFASPEDLQEHNRKKHTKEKPYECSICQKRFTQQGGVQQHMRMHTGDRPFPCTYCPKAFTQKSGLDQHLRTHTKQKPYICIVCRKAFVQAVHLKQHMRTHTNVAPFECAVCHKRFKQSSHLNYHLKNHNICNTGDENQSNENQYNKNQFSENMMIENSNDMEYDESQEETIECEVQIDSQHIQDDMDEYIIGDEYVLDN